MPLDDNLGSLGIESKPKKAKSKKKELPAFTNKKLAPHITKFLAGMKAKKDGEAKMAAAHALIADDAEEYRVEASRQKGEAQASITINGKIRFTQQGKYSKLDADHIETLEAEFGDDLAQYVSVTSDVVLKGEVLADKKKLEKLIEAVGKERFNDFFEISKSYNVKPALHEKLSVDEGFLEKHGHLIDDGILKRNKPTIVPA